MTTTSSHTSSPRADIHWRSINAIRLLSADAVQKAKSGHPGAPMGLAPTAYTLWVKFLRHNPQNPSWHDRDRFVLSAGHASMLLYGLLHLTGYDLPMDEIKRFRQWGSRTPGHPERGLAPGVEVTTGPLGQGVANAVGMAIAERVLADTYNRPGHEIVNHWTYAIASDGDMMEGLASEAASLAGTLSLGKLVVIYDDNEISIDGSTDLAFREDVPARFRAYGWHVVDAVGGNDLSGIEMAVAAARAETTRPSLLVVKTVIGFGAPTKAGKSSAHGAALGDEEVAGTRKNLGWDLPPFEVPEDVYGNMRGCVAEGKAAELAWVRRLDSYRTEYPDLAAAFERDMAGDLPDGWESTLDAISGTLNTKPVATRRVSGQALSAIAKTVPALMGGSADLAESNNTQVAGRGQFLPESPSGRNFNFGVREHGMAAICNGMAAHGGIIPYAGTFLIFSDYMRAAMRVGALSHLRSIWVLTHDSVGVGEDGPTHQPISQLMGLRLVPNMCVIRPADPDETIEAWRLAVRRKEGPTAIILTRQDVPPLALAIGQSQAKGNVEKGAYIIRDTTGTPDVVIIGTGSEVQHALGGAAMLEKEGIKARVVSMPSWDLFDAQPVSYREAVLPRSVRARVSVEAGTKLGWERYIGLDGEAVGMTGYGASAPGGVAMSNFGFTIEHVAAAARRSLEKARRT